MSGLLLLRRRLPATLPLSRYLQARHYALLGKQRTAAPQLHALPQTPVRTRFAPSPTGYLHLGSLRTALYNYLLARATGGQFIIRLEDTDQTRFVEDAETQLYNDLKWAGMHWDEGPDVGGPFGRYKQSERLDLYKRHAEILLNNGRAFRCFCSNKSQNAPVEPESGWTSGYPGTCQRILKPESDRRAANGEPHTIRFSSSKKPIEYVDIVYGPRKIKQTDQYPIIIKTDGFPTYHFANVVDDHDMKITHVIRGAEWLISTPLHVDMYQAFGMEPPSFGHVGLLVDQQRQKLSKRDRDNIGVSVFRANHILPQALLNFSVLLGWNPNLQQNLHLRRNGVMTLEEMQNNFSLKFTRGDIVVDLTKLKFFQSAWTRSLTSGEIQDEATVANHFVKPITSIVKRVDEILYKKDQYNQYSRKKRQHHPAPDVSPADASFLEDLGIEVENHHSLRFKYEEMSVEDHVLRLLNAAKGRIDSPEQFVRDCKYAFFPPSVKALNASATTALFDDMKNNVNSYYRQAKGRVIPRVKIHYIMMVYHNQLLCLRDQSHGKWTVENVGEKLKAIAECITVVRRDEDELEKHEPDTTAVWRYLKWAFLCGETQSEHISIVQLIVLWGAKRSFRMIRRAMKTAAVFQKVEDRNERLEKALKKHVVKRLQLREEETSQEAGESGETEGQDSVDILLPRDEKDAKELETPRRNMMRAAHREGPFVSRSPRETAAANSEPTYAQRTKPADVKLPAQMLEPSQWKDHMRRLPLNKTNGQRSPTGKKVLRKEPYPIDSDVPVGDIRVEEDKPQQHQRHNPKHQDGSTITASEQEEGIPDSLSPAQNPFAMGPLLPSGAQRRRSGVTAGALETGELREGEWVVKRIAERLAGRTPLGIAARPRGSEYPLPPPSTRTRTKPNPQDSMDGLLTETKIEEGGEKESDSIRPG